MNKYFEIYKKISDQELLDVLENITDYETEAVDAAKAEFSRRNIPISNLENLKNKGTNTSNKDIYNYKINTFSFYELFQPINNDSRKGIVYFNRILLILLIKVGYSLFKLVSSAGLYFSSFENLSISELFPFLLWVVAPLFSGLMVYLFYSKNKFAWFYFALTSLYGILSVPFLIYSFRTFWSSTGEFELPLSFGIMIVVGLVTGIYLFYLLFQKELRNIFDISKKSIKSIFPIALVLLVLYIVLVYFLGIML